MFDFSILVKKIYNKFIAKNKKLILKILVNKNQDSKCKYILILKVYLNKYFGV